jgi:hypothetical protein
VTKALFYAVENRFSGLIPRGPFSGAHQSLLGPQLGQFGWFTEDGPFTDESIGGTYRGKQVHFSKETDMASRTKGIGSTDPPESEAAVEETEGLVHLTHEQQIRIRAYEIYLDRGEQPGYELEDWLQAERELTK